MTLHPVAVLAALHLTLRGVLASSTAGYAIFGVFVVALVILFVLIIRWAIRQDRPGRAAWRDRQLEARRTRSDPPSPPA
jgi:hypothetical protein